MVAHGVSRGTDGEVGKPRRGERKTLVKRSFCRPSGAWNFPPQTHGSRRGLSSAAAPQLKQILKPVPRNAAVSERPAAACGSSEVVEQCRMLRLVLAHTAALRDFKPSPTPLAPRVMSSGRSAKSFANLARLLLRYFPGGHPDKQSPRRVCR